MLNKRYISRVTIGRVPIGTVYEIIDSGIEDWLLTSVLVNNEGIDVWVHGLEHLNFLFEESK